MLPEAPIAQGRTAEIYAWKEGQVLKLFYDWMSASGVEYEARVARSVHASGLPVPAVGEIVILQGHHGLVYERVDGPSMLQVFKTRPWKVFHFARLLAELHATMHTQKIPDLPSQRERLQYKIQHAKPLPEGVRQAALKALEGLPDGDRLCHGDFHPDNILMTKSGPIIIDWMDATRGNPILDVARSSILIGGKSLPPGTSLGWVIQILRNWFHRTYLNHYFHLRPDDHSLLEVCIPIVAAARLEEGIQDDEEWLVSLACRVF
jgi:Ser/Thr protein kinase RdoA (MazF antagonist)